VSALRAWLVVAVFALLAHPGVASACAVCFQAKTDASRIAFIATTGAMTAAPLILIGALAWWVRKRFRDAERDASPAPSAATKPYRPGLSASR